LEAQIEKLVASEDSEINQKLYFEKLLADFNSQREVWTQLSLLNSAS